MGAALHLAPRTAAAPVFADRGQAPPLAPSQAPPLPLQRMALRVSSASDAAEHEAAAAARQVVQTDAAVVVVPGIDARAAPAPVHRLARLQRAAADGTAATTVAPDTGARITARRGGGRPLPAPLRQFMEPRFGADFSAVRVHDDAEAALLSRRVAARAFTTGADVFFGAGEYQPGSAAGRELIAHELAHTVQQGAAPRVPARRPQAAGPAPTLSAQPAGRVQRLGLSDILDGLAALAANLPGYTLLTLILGRNPINQAVVERNAVNVLRAFMGLIPGGEVLFQVLQRQGVIDRLGAWLLQQTAALGLGFAAVRAAFTRFTDSLSWTDIFSPRDVWNRARGLFTPLIDRITGVVSGLVTQAVTWLKATFLAPLAGLARQIPGYGLVTVMLGRDPFTGEAVPRSALAVVRGFAEFIPGGTEKVDQLVQSGALQRAHAWFVQETTARNLTWARVTGTFAEAWASLQLADVLHPVDTLRRMVGLFRPLLADLVGFASAALMTLLELIYEAAMGAGGRRILALLMRVRATFGVIVRNPVGFLRNLLGAVGQGVRQFMRNILAHLRQGVIDWLAGPVARAGITVPERWDLRGIIGFVLQILGLTWARVRGKLVRLLGERVVAGLEGTFALVQQIRQRGLVAALRDRITEFFGGLRDAALGAIRSFIQQRLVMAGIQQLLSLLSPVGAVIQAILKTYTTLQFFVQRMQQILALVESIVNAIAAIAAGVIGTAANRIEQTMARTIPVVLDFLARFIGLGDVGGQVQSTIRGLQARVDGMLDRAVDWIRRQAAGLASRALGGNPTAPPAERVRSALREAVPLVNRFAGRPVGALVLRPLLAPLRLRHRLSRLDVVPTRDTWSVAAAASPEVIEPTSARVDTAAGTGIAGLTTAIRYTSGTLAGTGRTVGTEMVADPLGPDHPTGQEPAGANVWSALLVTDPGQSNDRKYIRGHLLNHQVGGSGAAQNLFPITAAANDVHESAIESRIKTWVNTERKWVHYRVRVTNIVADVNPRRLPRNNKVDADFVCEAHVIDATVPPERRTPQNPIRATIRSRFRAAAEVADAAGPARGAEAATAVRPEDRAATVALPSGHEYRLDAGLFDAVVTARGRGLGDAALSRAMQTGAGIGPAIAATVLHAQRAAGRGTDIATALSTAERANLTQANRLAATIAAALAAAPG